MELEEKLKFESLENSESRKDKNIHRNLVYMVALGLTLSLSLLTRVYFESNGYREPQVLKDIRETVDKWPSKYGLL